MKMAIGGTALAIALVLSAFAGTGASANPNPRLVLVTNNSRVCVRFDAIGVRDLADYGPHHGSGEGARGSSGGPHMEQVGPYEKIDAAPGHTVRFEKLAADRAHVWASPHVGDCNSALTGTFVGLYETRGPREHIAFEQTQTYTFRFMHVSFP